jgi:DNA repair protein RadC
MFFMLSEARLMPIHPSDPTRLFRTVEKSLRTCAGKRFSPTAKRWRNTRSDENAPPQLDTATARFLIRFGIMDAGDDAADRQTAFAAFLQSGARTLGEAPGVLAAHLHAFAAGEDGWPGTPLCGEKPRCSACPLCEGCRYLASGAKVERMSSTTLARRLAGDAPSAHLAPGAAELLALLLFGERKGAGAVARVQALLEEAGGLRELLQPGPSQDDGRSLAPQAKARLRALRELIEHWSRERRTHGRVFSSAGDLHEHYHLRLRELKQECFCVACLDQKNHMLADEQVSTGSLTEALVHPREVLSTAIRNRAAAIAVVHNHPSGDPAPSRADRQLTQRLKEAANLVGIRMLDHVIVGDGRYYSFAESGAL